MHIDQSYRKKCWTYMVTPRRHHNMPRLKKCSGNMINQNTHRKVQDTH